MKMAHTKFKVYTCRNVYYGSILYKIQFFAKVLHIDRCNGQFQFANKDAFSTQIVKFLNNLPTASETEFKSVNEKQLQLLQNKNKNKSTSTLLTGQNRTHMYEIQTI